ncbi:papain-like cysteine protease family protein [uncultured Aquimarina sp.]|uniref:papain-like cysteine protease family protein n=1 Tax=uncultured Aquimarina sp. TaxID=575652 RepID=UPI0026061907|nr:papain-like cysteine protease family protein [uncultured Aquimarina sp.]
MPETENKFYSFNINYVSQSRTNWCWAACFQWIIDFLDYESEIGSTQEHLALYYHNTHNNINHEGQDYSLTYINRPIKLTDIPKLIGDIFGFDCNETDFITISNNRAQLSLMTNQMLDYQFVKSTLNNNNFPIILAISTGNAPNHIVLITGYGIKDGCEYILISNPNNREQEEFWVDEKYVSKIMSRIKKIWITKNTFNDVSKIQEDNFTKHYTNTSIEFNKSIRDNISIPNLDDFGILFLAQDINNSIINYKDKDSAFLSSIISEKIKSFEFTSNCDRFISKKDVKNLEIIFNSLKKYLETGILDIRIDDFENVISEHETRIKLNDVQGELYVTIKEAPEELDLINKNILNSELHKILETHKK